MPSFLFYFFALMTLGFGVLVVTSRNPVTSALSLAVCFVGLAALFISLDAYLIGTLQVLVYAGAVMVLFLFIIMLLDIKAEEGKKANIPAVASGILLAVILILQIVTVTSSYDAGHKTLAETKLELTEAAGYQKLETITRDLNVGTLPDAKLMGQTLFQRYAFHLQVVGLLLLVGTVGVVMLSKKEKINEPS